MLSRLPAWFRQEVPDGLELEFARILSASGVKTVCKEAKCPNMSACFKKKHLTFMILGGSCTRNCRFCNINKSRCTSLPLDTDEPLRVADFVKELDIRDVVITSVTRDDLPDGGSGQFARTIELIRGIDKSIKIEVLIPDFKGSPESIGRVVSAGPDILGHNIETVKRLYPGLRPASDYDLSLGVLKMAKDSSPRIITKSSMMLGLGEDEAEVAGVMEDLRRAGCDILNLGQYLAPSKEHYPVKEFIPMEKFGKYKETAFAMGFSKVSSAPLVRSSYREDEV